MQKETRHFKMHSKLLMDVIKRQAGTLSKAIAEGVSNADDAKAKKVSITLTEEALTILDNGGGFKSADEIKLFFEVFGQPHEESENKKFGTFRMGRGQLFSFGRNEWRTGKFMMVVDIKERGLDYDLLTGEENFDGCNVAVNLYEPMSLSAMADTERDLKIWCKWLYPIRVYCNSKLISFDPEIAKWTKITDEAYIKLDDSPTLRVYNLGMMVCEFSKHKFGTGGEVVSRQQLRVNFARNDIQADCPVWRKIRPLVNKIATEKNVGKKSLGDDERQRLADQLLRDEIPGDYAAKQLKLFTAVTGRHFSAADVMYPRLSNVGRYPAYSVCAKGNTTGDMIMRRGMAFVFAEETLTRFNVTTVPALLKWVKKTFAADHEEDSACSAPYIPFAKLAKSFSDSRVILPSEEYTAAEQTWMMIMLAQADHLIIGQDSPYHYNGRRLLIGASDSCNGWTDAETFVAVSRNYLAQQDFDVPGFTNVGTLLLHEACHHTPDHDGHDHDQTFYEEYHDATRSCLGKFIAGCVQYLPKAAVTMSRKQMRTVDKAKAAQRAGGKIKLAAETSPAKE